jgi:hypothetical protein
MSSRRGLTGGTGDVNPQFLSWSVVQDAADSTTTLAVNIPVQRLPTTGRAQVMEVLSVKYDGSTLGGSSTAEVPRRYDASLDDHMELHFDEWSRSLTVRIATRNPGTTAVGYNDPSVFSYYNKTKYGIFTAGGSYFIIEHEPYVDDLTDGAGHGYLVATDIIYIQISSQQTGSAQSCQGKLYYRWKNVNLQEYIGIVQGQQ